MILASFALASSEVKAVNATPSGVDLVKFPILKDGGLTIEKTVDLELIPTRLEEPVVVFNHYRIDNSWRVQTLQKGDLVYKDQKTGELRYRAFCSNRIEVVKTCPASPVVPHDILNPKKELGWLDNMADKFSDAWRAATGAVGTAWGSLLPVLGFLALPLVAGGWWLYRRLRPVPAPIPPAVPPTPPTVTTPPTPYRRSPGTTLSSPPSPLGRNQKM